MLKKFLYVFISILIAFVCFFEFSQTSLSGFIDSIENKTFDVRQKIISKNKQASKDIILVTIDDASYEYALDNIGEWPLPRGLYADVVEYLETQNPKLIAFDMLFVKSAKNNVIQDKAAQFGQQLYASKQQAAQMQAMPQQAMQPQAMAPQAMPQQ